MARQVKNREAIVQEYATVESVKRALGILGLFEDEQELGLVEIGQRLNLSKSSVHRLLKTLEEKGYICQEPETRKYKLGIRVLQLGLNMLNNIDLRAAALPVMKKLVSVVGETTALVILSGREGICIEKIDSPHRIRIFTEVGRIIPLYYGAMGKAILANQPDEVIEEVLKENAENIKKAPLYCHNPQLIVEDLQRIREAGYAFSSGEITTGAASVAAPVRNHRGNVIACLSCAGPATRFSSVKLTEIISLVRESADELSKLLGFRGETSFFA